MHSLDILDDPNVRHYLPPSKPQVKVNFYQINHNEVVIQPRTIEICEQNNKIENLEIEKKRYSHDLLSKPIDQLLLEIEQKSAENSKKESVKKEILEQEKMDDIKGISDSENEEEKDDLLWVDKYEPESFLDLVTEERTNRELLIWLKTWDKLVFPHKPKPQMAQFASHQNTNLTTGYHVFSLYFTI